MKTVKERLKNRTLALKRAGVNLPRLRYPLSVEPWGTFSTPQELLATLSRLSDKEFKELTQALKAKSKDQLEELYKEFKTQAEEVFKSLPSNLKKVILSKGKPELKHYTINETTLRVFLRYDGEELFYNLFLGSDRELLKLKAMCLVSDLKDIATGDYIPF